MVNPPAKTGDLRDRGSISGLGRLLGRRHSNPLQYLAWRIPWTEEPGGLQSRRKITKSWTRLKQLSTHT